MQSLRNLLSFHACVCVAIAGILGQSQDFLTNQQGCYSRLAASIAASQPYTDLLNKVIKLLQKSNLDRLYLETAMATDI